MTLNFLVVFERKQVNEGLEETGLDDRRLVLWVYRNITNACSRREDKRQISRLKKAQKGREAVGLYDFKLVFL